MKLVIISNMAHYRTNGEIVGWGPTVQEIDHLAEYFDEVVHLGCLHSEEAPESALPYSASNVRLVAVPPAGGNRLIDKADILRRFPLYARAIHTVVQEADVVHVRAPANIALLALSMLTWMRTDAQCWVKYAGNWESYDGEPRAYKLQRWYLKQGYVPGVVTVNGKWPDQADHIHSFVNPCLTDSEVELARAAAIGKTIGEDSLRLLAVGRLAEHKGIHRAVHVLARLREQAVPAVLDVIGGGSDRDHLERLAMELGVHQHVKFHGWVSRTALADHYAPAHVLLVPSDTEGWPKVLSEGMAFGVVPLASRVGSIPHYLDDFQVGRTFAPDDVAGFASAAAAYWRCPESWKEESQRGIGVAPRFTFSAYVRQVESILNLTRPVSR